MDFSKRQRTDTDTFVMATGPGAGDSPSVAMDFAQTPVDLGLSSEHPFINRQIRKEFDGDMYTGSVKEVISVLYDGDGEDKAVLIFKVKYEDNDEDELEYDECERFLVPVEGEVGVGC